METTGITVDGGDRNESVSLQDRDGYCGEAYSNRTRHGVRIAELDEMSIPQEAAGVTSRLTDFWRVGQGYAKKLAEYGIVHDGRCGEMLGRKDK